MKRTIIKIDEELCNGCELCVEGCHEGALQMIDGKARMISDLYCDGLGACIPECPVGAISLEEREAEPYDEIKVMERIAPKGEATVIAHLNHLIEHNQDEYVAQGIQYIKDHNLEVDLGKLKEFQAKEEPAASVLQANNERQIQGTHSAKAADDRHGAGAFNSIQSTRHTHRSNGNGGGCPGARMMQFGTPGPAKKQVAPDDQSAAPSTGSASALRQWPVQLHLVNPQAPFFQNADVLLAADCVAFAMGDFHSRYLPGKGLAIACPKLDQGKDVYVDKLTAMINDAHINTITVMVMEVPCCTGLLQLAKQAADKASRKVPVKAITVGLQGDVTREEWL